MASTADKLLILNPDLTERLVEELDGFIDVGLGRIQHGSEPQRVAVEAAFADEQAFWRARSITCVWLRERALSSCGLSPVRAPASVPCRARRR